MEIRNIVLIVVFILGLVYMQLLQARSVDEIINKHVEARGGKKKLNLIHSLYMEGIREVIRKEISIQVTKVHGKLYRNDFEYDGKRGFTEVTPGEGWAFIPRQSQKVESITGDRLKTMQFELDIHGPLIEYASKGNKAERDGKESIEGKEAYKIKITLSNGKEVMYFIDTETFLVLQIRETKPRLDGDVEKEIITNFSDYRPIDGVMFPHRIINPGQGLASGSTIFTEIKVNSVNLD
jgi:hypothetical protein